MLLDLNMAKSYFAVEKQLNIVAMAKKKADIPNSEGLKILVKKGKEINSIN